MGRIKTKIGCKSKNKRRQRINPISEKQRKHKTAWNDITMRRIWELTHKYGKPLCEYCGKPGYIHDYKSPYYLRGHHINKKSQDDRPENCYVAHNCCHNYIHDHNLVVSQLDFKGRENGQSVLDY